MQHIWALEGEREARGQEATEAAQRHAQALEQVKLRDMAAADLQKKVPPPSLTGALLGTLGHTLGALAWLPCLWLSPCLHPCLPCLCCACFVASTSDGTSIWEVFCACLNILAACSPACLCVSIF